MKLPSALMAPSYFRRCGWRALNRTTLLHEAKESNHLVDDRKDGSAMKLRSELRNSVGLTFCPAESREHSGAKGGAFFWFFSFRCRKEKNKSGWGNPVEDNALPKAFGMGSKPVPRYSGWEVFGKQMGSKWEVFGKQWEAKPTVKRHK